MSEELALDIRRAMERLPGPERSFLLELVGLAPRETKRAPPIDVTETLTQVALATRAPGEHLLETPLGRLDLRVGREGELLNATSIDPLRPLRAGLVTGLPAAERPTAFALIVSLAMVHRDAFDASDKRDLVSLVSLALGDALTRR
jgi:hypothetical protein